MKSILSLIMLVLFLSITNQSSVSFSNDFNVNKINEIFLVNHGWHTGFVIPSEEIKKKIPAIGERFRDNPNIEFGWGDKNFYQSNDFFWGITISAMLWPTDSVIHSVAVPINVERFFSNSEVEKICLSNAEFSSLILFISNSFFRDENGNLEKLKKGLYGDSQFYRGVDDFHIMNTCNRWTAKGLKSIGLEISTADKLTASSVMNIVKKYKKDKNLRPYLKCMDELN